MNVVTAEEMRVIDKRTISEFGLPGHVLMERAGLSVAIKIRELFQHKKVLVISGAGNNGGDGLVAARILFGWGWSVKVILLKKEDRLSPDCLTQYRIAKKMGVAAEFRTSISGKDLHSAVVVDAMFGTGINKPVTNAVAAIIRFLNSSSVPVIAVDIPSGISADNGRILGEAVRADYTVTFGLPKIGHFLHPGKEFSGKLFVEDIGFPPRLLKSDSIMTRTIERTYASGLVPERPEYSHKGDYGHILVVAGSRGKTGAALMAARACLRSGAGMVTIGVAETLADIIQSRVTEEMVLPLPDTGKGSISDAAYEAIMEFAGRTADVLAIGPGLTAGAHICGLLKKIIMTSTIPMVLDADAINALAGILPVLRKAKAPVILTPHAGEMARLMGAAGPGSEERNIPEKELVASIENDKVELARTFARQHGVYLVLKGAPALVAEPAGEVFINTTGNPGMATAGTGDVLTGMIASFLGQGLNPFDAAVFGTYLHGLAGDMASSDKGMHSVIASDVIGSIPSAFGKLSEPV